MKETAVKPNSAQLNPFQRQLLETHSVLRLTKTSPAMYLLYSLSLLLAASSGYCQRVPLEPVNPDSRLAAWSQSYDGTIPADCSDESASGEKLKTVIYYQQDGGHLDDASKIGSGDWTQGSLTAQAREKSPLAVVHWVDGRLGDVVSF